MLYMDFGGNLLVDLDLDVDCELICMWWNDVNRKTAKNLHSRSKNRLDFPQKLQTAANLETEQLHEISAKNRKTANAGYTPPPLGHRWGQGFSLSLVPNYIKFTFYFRSTFVFFLNYYGKDFVVLFIFGPSGTKTYIVKNESGWRSRTKNVLPVFVSFWSFSIAFFFRLVKCQMTDWPDYDMTDWSTSLLLTILFSNPPHLTLISTKNEWKYSIRFTSDIWSCKIFVFE